MNTVHAETLCSLAFAALCVEVAARRAAVVDTAAVDVRGYHVAAGDQREKHHERGDILTALSECHTGAARP